MKTYKIKHITFITLTLIANTVFAEDAVKKDDTEEELAMKLQNPVASLISVPFQNNWDFGIGSTNAIYHENVYDLRDKHRIYLRLAE